MASEKIYQLGLSMNSVPEKYSSGNHVQRWYFKQNTEEFAIPWQDGDVVLDVGCGTGEVTHLMLQSSQQIQRVVAFDLNPAFIDYATKNRADDRVDFIVGDAAGSWPSEWTGSFNKVVSFTAVHYVDNQEQFMRNTLSVLRPGGTLYITFPNRHGVDLTNVRILSDPKWNKFLPKDSLVNAGESSWKEAPIYRALLEKAGFEVQHVTEVQRDYDFPNDDALMRFLRGLNFFTNHIPIELRDEFELAFLTLFQEIQVETHGRPLTYRSWNLIAQATKPQ